MRRSNCQKCRPPVHGIHFVLAGRPEPQKATTTEKIIEYPLRGLRKETVKSYIEHPGLPWIDNVEALCEGSQGNTIAFVFRAAPTPGRGRWPGCG